jgi:hypothetical protein
MHMAHQWYLLTGLGRVDEGTLEVKYTLSKVKMKSLLMIPKH